VSSLLVLTENTLTQHDVDRIIGAHDDTLRVHVLVPESPEGPPAEEVLETSVTMLRDSGATAEGSTTPHDPVVATEAAATAYDVDDVWVITEPHLVADFLRRDWATRIRANLELPVLHVIGGTDEVIS
jgi:hypothetical protein